LHENIYIECLSHLAGSVASVDREAGTILLGGIAILVVQECQNTLHKAQSKALA
jgi:hypothetical protein